MAKIKPESSSKADETSRDEVAQGAPARAQAAHSRADANPTVGPCPQPVADAAGETTEATEKAPGVQPTSLILDRFTLSFMDRIRSIEFAKLELERKLEKVERERIELIAAGQVQSGRLNVDLNRLRKRLEAVQAEHAAAMQVADRDAAQREQELLARIDAVNSELAAGAVALQFAEAQVKQRASRIEELLLQLSKRESELEHAKGTGRVLESEKHSLEAAIAGLRRELRERDEMLEQQQSLLDGQAQEAVRQTALLTDTREELAITTVRLDEWRGRAVESEKRLHESLDSGGRLKLELEQAAVAMDLANDRLREEGQQNGELRDSLLAAGARETNLVEALANAREAIGCHEYLISELEAKVAQVEQEASAIRDSVSFRIGEALTGALSSRAGLAAFPARLAGIVRKVRHRGEVATSLLVAAPGLSEVESRNERHVQEVLTRHAQHGFDAARTFAARLLPEDAQRAQVLTEVAKRLLPTDPETGLKFGRLAHRVEPAAYRTKWLAFASFDAGEVGSAAALLSDAPEGQVLRPSERHKAAQVLGTQRLLAQLPRVPDRAPSATFEPVSGRVLYVAASALPFHQSGYTLRTQWVLSTLRERGLDVTCVTRPGYPADRPDALQGEGAAVWQTGTVPYRALPGPGRRRLAPDEYLAAAAEALHEAMAETRPELVHAASNYENALPALIAARRAGVPFVYEVRGLWELSSAARVPGWQERERFRLERDLETLVAREADRVVTLNQRLADELVARGVDPARIRLAPNAVPEDMAPVCRDATLAASLGLADATFVVGYAGSLVGYEGIADLLEAIAQLLPEQPGLRGLIVGDGAERGDLEQRAVALGIANHVVFTGRVPPESVAAYLAQCDCVALPRKPDLVCEIVSPLKPMEAMALGVPLVASDVGALRDLITDGETGLLHRPSDPQALASAIRRLANDAELRGALASKARQWVFAERTWPRVVERVVATYVELSERFAQPVDAIIGDPIGQFLVALPAGRNTMDEQEKVALDDGIAKAFSFAGGAGVESLVARQSEGRSDKFFAFCALKGATACLNQGDADAAMKLSRQASERCGDLTTLRGAATVHFSCGDDVLPRELIARMKALLPEPNESVARLERQIEARRTLFLEAATHRPMAVEPTEKRSVNFLHFSLPYTSVGYATRSHGIALGVAGAGWDIRPCTRPGFPVDFKPELEGTVIPEFDLVDGVRYRRLAAGGRKGTTEAEYLLAAADRCEQVLREERPAVVHAASNYTTALPALVAARRLGLPFLYEIRGFWEITRSSRDAAFEKSIKYRTMQHYEDLVVREADHIITITTAMKDELIERGVDPHRISIAYNSVDPERFVPTRRDDALAARLGIPSGIPVIGYIGSLVDYEGLDDLVVASAQLRREGVDFRLLIVGDGAVSDSLRQMIDEHGLADVAMMPGRVPHEEVEAYYSLIDIAPFPRKPWQVCELVSPLKPFEAMAMEKPVVVSGTRALLEIVTDGLNGFVFQKGDAQSLADVLGRLIADPELRKRVGGQARAWVEEFRSWRRAGRDVVDAYAALHASVAARDGDAGRAG